MSLHLKHQENTLLHFDCYFEGNASIKKCQRKNLAQAIYYIRIHQRVRSKMCHLGMPAKQPHILSHVDYICWTRPFHKSIFYEIAKDWLYLLKDTSSVMGERQRSEMNLKAPTKIWSM